MAYTLYLALSSEQRRAAYGLMVRLSLWPPPPAKIALEYDEDVLVYVCSRSERFKRMLGR